MQWRKWCNWTMLMRRLHVPVCHSETFMMLYSETENDNKSTCRNYNKRGNCKQNTKHFHSFIFRKREPGTFPEHSHVNKVTSPGGSSHGAELNSQAFPEICGSMAIYFNILYIGILHVYKTTTDPFMISCLPKHESLVRIGSGSNLSPAICAKLVWMNVRWSTCASVAPRTASLHCKWGISLYPIPPLLVYYSRPGTRSGQDIWPEGWQDAGKTVPPESRNEQNITAGLFKSSLQLESALKY